MKKIFTILVTLSLLCAACAATADLETPDFDSMPAVVLEDEDTTVEEAAFEGEWVLKAAFAGREYVYDQTLAESYDFNFMPYVIGDGKITQDEQNEFGEFVKVEMPYTFEAGQLQGEDKDGRAFAVELLEDGNIVMSVLYPGEGDEMVCLSLFLTHPAE